MHLMKQELTALQCGYRESATPHEIWERNMQLSFQYVIILI